MEDLKTKFSSYLAPVSCIPAAGDQPKKCLSEAEKRQQLEAKKTFCEKTFQLGDPASVVFRLRCEKETPSCDSDTSCTSLPDVKALLEEYAKIKEIRKTDCSVSYSADVAPACRTQLAECETLAQCMASEALLNQQEKSIACQSAFKGAPSIIEDCISETIECTNREQCKEDAEGDGIDASRRKEEYKQLQTLKKQFPEGTCDSVVSCQARAIVTRNDFCDTTYQLFEEKKERCKVEVSPCAKPEDCKAEDSIIKAENKTVQRYCEFPFVERTDEEQPVLFKPCKEHCDVGLAPDLQTHSECLKALDRYKEFLNVRFGDYCTKFLKDKKQSKESHLGQACKVLQSECTSTVRCFQNRTKFEDTWNERNREIRGSRTTLRDFEDLWQRDPEYNPFVLNPRVSPKQVQLYFIFAKIEEYLNSDFVGKNKLDAMSAAKAANALIQAKKSIGELLGKFVKTHVQDWINSNIAFVVTTFHKACGANCEMAVAECEKGSFPLNKLCAKPASLTQTQEEALLSGLRKFQVDPEPSSDDDEESDSD